MLSFKKEEIEQDSLGSYVWVKGYDKLSSIIQNIDGMLVCMHKIVIVR
jgi:hypothetical protein